MISSIQSLDMRVLETLYALREPGWVVVAIWVSELGEWYTVCGLALALVLWLLLRRHLALAQGVALSVATSGIATFLLKSIVARPRPPEHFWAYTETWYSFPSAHAAMGLAFYGFLAYMVLQSEARRACRVAAVIAAAALVLVIGFSRLYLGVHYLSDVLGGYLLGALCLWLSVWTTRTLKRK